MCDNCGRVISTRADEKELREWYALERDPVDISPRYPVFTTALTITAEDDEPVEVDATADDYQRPPAVHFCGDACLSEWARKNDRLSTS